MPPKKRRGKSGDPEHHGRVTPRRGASFSPLGGSQASIDEARVRDHRADRSPSQSGRYTPPTRSVRLRPDWHKVVGVAFLVVGISIAVLNDVMLLGATTMLPGGHSEAYLFLGVGIAGYSTWWFGWFDREH